MSKNIVYKQLLFIVLILLIYNYYIYNNSTSIFYTFTIVDLKVGIFKHRN